MLFQAKKLSDHFKENIEVSLFLKDGLSMNQARDLEMELSAQPYAKSVRYISKEDAAQEFAGEYDASVLEDNPLPASMNMYLNARYANPDSMAVILPGLEGHTEVSEVVYQQGILDMVSNNINRIGLYLVIASLLFALVAFTLIDSAIRLSMYAKRFLIKSMQLVGATNKFIIAPFIQRGILNGLLSAVIAIIMLLGLYYYFTSNYSGLFNQEDFTFFSMVLIGVIVVGILISLLSTYVAVRKYLRSRVEDLY